MTISDFLDPIHLCRHAIEMDGDNCFCSRRDRRLKLTRRHCSTQRIDIDKNRCRADIANCPGSSYERHRNCYYFVTGPDIETAQGKMERARAAVETYTVIGFAVGCKFRFEIRRGWSLSKLPGLADFAQCR